MSIEQVIHSYPGVFGVLMFLIGLVAGNWLAIGRDKRKEFNSAALPIREWLLEEIRFPHGHSRYPTNVEVDQFVNRLHWLNRIRFSKTYKKQEAERKKILAQNPVTGEIFYENTDHLVSLLKTCLNFTKLK